MPVIMSLVSELTTTAGEGFEDSVAEPDPNDSMLCRSFFNGGPLAALDMISY